MNLLNLLNGNNNQQDQNHNEKQRVFNLIILDESGSMYSIYTQALQGINSTLTTIREAQSEHPDQEHYVSLVTFNTLNSRIVYQNTPIHLTKPFAQSDYRPNGGTPLLDAIGHSITALEPMVKPEDLVLVTIITDGEENASTHYRYHQIKEMIERLKAKDWIFTFIGANINVADVSAKMGIDNAMAWESTPTGSQDMFDKECASRKDLYNRVSANESRTTLKKNYFKI